MLSTARCREQVQKTPTLALCLAVIASACGTAKPQAAQQVRASGQPSTEIVHEECNLEAEGAIKIDANNDGRPDIVQVMKGGRELCRAIDFNFDGRIDTFLYFDAQGKLRRRESDFDRDGLIDEIAYYKNGVISEKHRETNLDNKLDTWDTFKGGRLSMRRLDTNRDGKVDQWWTFPDPSKPECPVIALDETGEGKPTSRHEPCRDPNSEPTVAIKPPPSAAPQPAPQKPGGGT